MKIKKIAPYLIAIVVFAVVALLYFSPVLKGEKLFQSDIQQFRGMSKEIVDYREAYGEEPYWTNAAFSGMPSYQLSTYYPNDYIKKIDSLIRFLPRPADYLFLYFLGFFVLLMVLKFDWKLAIIGSLAFGFSTYFIIIFGAGHNAKAHAIGYISMVFAGVLLVFQKRYLTGFFLTTIALALELNTSHPQMTYYMLFSLLILGLVVLIESVKEKQLQVFIRQVGVLFLAGFLALAMNASSLLATKEYADYSTRGKSELTITPEGKQKEQTSGLSKDYITAYSVGVLETLNVFIPRFMGGASVENLGEDSHTYALLNSRIDSRQAKDFSKSLPTYWGSQPGVSGPPYIGAVFVFLFVLGIFLVEARLKKWLVGTVVLSIVLSWGHNFSLVTDFFINYIPLYNKFRAVSSIQILAEIAAPLLGMLGLKELLFGEKSTSEKLAILKKSFYIVGGLALFFTVFGTSILDFYRATPYDNMIKGFSGAIEADRKAIFFDDSLRSFLLVLFTAVLLFGYIKGSLKKTILFGGLALLLLFDMVGVARRYVDESDFHKAIRIEKPFVKSSIDKAILKDKSHYRVANFTLNFMNDGATSYFHNSIGGYHAAKLGRYQELVDFHIAKNNLQVLNMLNTKYFILPDEEGNEALQVNSDANGNAWFVNDVKFVSNANEEILSLASFNSKSTAIVNKNEFPKFYEAYKKTETIASNSVALDAFKTNEFSYSVQSDLDQLLVFSEIYYKDGWNAYIDGKQVPYIRANYVLRALQVPAGEHKIVFKFEPTVIAKGNIINLGALIFFLGILAFGYFKNRKRV